MTPSHRKPDPPAPAAPASWFPPGVARRNSLALAFANAVAAVGLGFGDPGASPALQFLRSLFPLPWWAVGYALAAALLLLKRHEVGHVIAVLVWVMLGFGAVLGLVTGTTSSPAGTVLLTGLVLCITGLHVNGVVYRARQRRRDSL